MKAIKFLVETMFRNILTAGTFAVVTLFAITSCSDELSNDTSDSQSDKAPAGADTRLLEAYGLMFSDFVTANDVQILDADTTEISVSKKLADKLGIKSFVGHPIGIWQAVDQLPYARKATEERMVGDLYILKVVPATVAELIGDRSAVLSTSIYVNNDANNLKRAAANGPSAFGAKYVDESGVIHPAVIHLTDPYGYDKAYHNETDQPVLKRSIPNDGHFDYITADELASGQSNRRAKMHVNVLSIHDKISFRHNFGMRGSPTDSISLYGQLPIDYDLNYFMTLEGGVKWDGWLPELYVKKFETGVDGDCAFQPEAYLSFTARADLKKQYERLTLATFGQYTFTFVVGPVPVCITVKPSVYLKFTANAEGGVRIGFKYDYASQFKAGIRYEHDWKIIKDFEELRNKFEFYKPEANFSANAGIGFYLGVDVLVYGVAGPEVGVGPDLTGKVSGVIRPAEENPDNRFDFKASVELNVRAFAGAKLSLLGYEVARWDTEYVLAGPWTLFKYPSDGTEHKDPDKQKQEDKNAFWKDRVLKVLANLSEMADFYKNYENEVNQLMNMDNMTRETAVSSIANTVLATYDIATINLNDYNTKLDLWSKYLGLQRAIQERFDKYTRMNQMSMIIESVKASEQYKLYNDNVMNWGDRVEFDKISVAFEKKYGRLPEYNASDVRIVLNMTLAYSELYFNSQSDAGSVYTYLMNHVHERNCWAPKSVRVRAAYETILLWKKGYGKYIAGKENFENMAEDFNALIPSIYQLSKMGFDI